MLETKPLKPGQEPTPTPDPAESDMSQPGNSSSDAKTQRSESQKAQAVADLLNGSAPQPESSRAPAFDDDGTPTDPDAPDVVPTPAEGDTKSSKPANLHEAAERLGMETKDLYKLELSTQEGETVTLGALKDAWQNRQAHEQEIVKRNVQLDERENVTLQAQVLWAQLGEQAAATLTDQQLMQLKQQMVEREEAERATMLKIMPELAEPQTFAKFRQDAVDLLTKHYRYQESEIVINDSRQLQVIRDNIRMRKRLADLEAFQPKPVSPTSTQSKGNANPGANKARSVAQAKAGGDAQKVHAISQLIGNR